MPPAIAALLVVWQLVFTGCLVAYVRDILEIPLQIHCFSRNTLRIPFESDRFYEGYPRVSLANPWISQGISLGSLFMFIGFVRDTVYIVSLRMHGFRKEYA